VAKTVDLHGFSKYKLENKDVLFSVWIIMAWQHISPEVNVKGFKKCCISSAVNRTDDMLWNGSEEDGNVNSVCVCGGCRN
jgi:hypothetical protein